MKQMISAMVWSAILFATTACMPVQPQAAEAPVSAPTGESVVETGDGCEPAAEGWELLVHTAHGYCLHYPVEYDSFEPNADETVLVIGSLMNHVEPRLSVTVRDAAGETAESAADAIVADVEAGMPGHPVTRTTIVVGGEPAVVLDNLPGQDINRRVLVVHEGRLYDLWFFPADPAEGDLFARMETLYAGVLASFRFLPAVEAAAFEPVLVWEGTPMDGGECQRLEIDGAGLARLGPCGSEGEVVNLFDNHGQEWQEIMARFAPFELEGEAGRLRFAGTGEIEGEAWQRAIETWARFTQAELAAGRVGASLRTVLSWWLGEVEGSPGECRHLVVLAYGVAYANVEPCAGGAPASSSTTIGWLETDEWETFDEWLYGFAPVYSEDNYLGGFGSQEMSEDEVNELAAWADAVYTRLRQ